MQFSMGDDKSSESLRVRRELFREWWNTSNLMRPNGSSSSLSPAGHSEQDTSPDRETDVTLTLQDTPRRAAHSPFMPKFEERSPDSSNRRRNVRQRNLESMCGKILKICKGLRNAKSPKKKQRNSSNNSSVDRKKIKPKAIVSVSKSKIIIDKEEIERNLVKELKLTVKKRKNEVESNSSKSPERSSVNRHSGNRKNNRTDIKSNLINGESKKIPSPNLRNRKHIGVNCSEFNKITPKKLSQSKKEKECVTGSTEITKKNDMDSKQRLDLNTAETASPERELSQPHSKTSPDLIEIKCSKNVSTEVVCAVNSTSNSQDLRLTKPVVKLSAKQQEFLKDLTKICEMKDKLVLETSKHPFSPQIKRKRATNVNTVVRSSRPIVLNKQRSINLIRKMSKSNASYHVNNSKQYGETSRPRNADSSNLLPDSRNLNLKDRNLQHGTKRNILTINRNTIKSTLPSQNRKESPKNESFFTKHNKLILPKQCAMSENPQDNISSSGNTYRRNHIIYRVNRKKTTPKETIHRTILDNESIHYFIDENITEKKLKANSKLHNGNKRYNDLSFQKMGSEITKCFKNGKETTESSNRKPLTKNNTKVTFSKNTARRPLQAIRTLPAFSTSKKNDDKLTFIEESLQELLLVSRKNKKNNTGGRIKPHPNLKNPKLVTSRDNNKKSFMKHLNAKTRHVNNKKKDKSN